MSRAAPFFDDKQYLRTVVAEKPPAASAAQAEGQLGSPVAGQGR